MGGIEMKRGLIVLMIVFGAALLVTVWPSKAQTEDDTSIQVGLVIQGADNQPQTYCVTLDSDHRTGLDALQAAGLDLNVESGSMGSTVCRINGDGCDTPGQSCFCQCEGSGSCAYWSYFHRTEEGTWTYNSQGAAAMTLDQGDVQGWWWKDSSQTDVDFTPISFAEICGSDFPRTITDGLDRDVTIAAPPQKIASVTLGSDEILLDLVGPERLLGVSYFATDPAISNIADRLDDIPHADLSGTPEYLISLDADLVVLAGYNNPAALDQLQDADVPVFVLGEFNTIDDLRANIRLLGQVTGEETRAEEIITEMDDRIEAVETAVADQDPVRVLYYEPGGITYGPGSTVDEMITLAGGINVVSESDLGAYPLVNAEYVLAADPDVILLGGWFAGTPDPLAGFTGDPVFSTLRAVQTERVYAVSDAHMTNVSQYVAVGIEDIAHVLYPEAFDEE
jgi:iron complex transport system substrate-binding protein